MRQIIQKFHDNDPNEIKNQHLFLAQTLMAVTLVRDPENFSVAERVL